MIQHNTQTMYFKRITNHLRALRYCYVQHFLTAFSDRNALQK